jgi:tetratricopeptide (TPR) repeat protein
MQQRHDAVISTPYTRDTVTRTIKPLLQQRELLQDTLQAVDKGEWSFALSLCERAIETNEEHKAYLSHIRGEIALLAGDFKAASISFFDAMAFESSDSLWARAGIARCKQAEGDYEFARKIYQGMLRQDEQQQGVYQPLAQALEKTGRADEAAAVIEHALLLNPDDKTLRQELNHYKQAAAQQPQQKAAAPAAKSVDRTTGPTPSPVFDVDECIAQARHHWAINEINQGIIILTNGLTNCGNDASSRTRLLITLGVFFLEQENPAKSHECYISSIKAVTANHIQLDKKSKLDLARLAFGVGRAQEANRILVM